MIFKAQFFKHVRLYIKFGKVSVISNLFMLRMLCLCPTIYPSCELFSFLYGLRETLFRPLNKEIFHFNTKQ